MRSAAIGLSLAAMSFAPAPDRLLAQEPGPGTFVAIPNVFPDIDARAIVVREGRREIILLRPDEATPEALAVALGELRRAKEAHPSPELGQMIPITGFVLGRPLAPEQRARLERALDALSERPVTDLGRMGPGRWIRWTTR